MASNRHGKFHSAVKNNSVLALAFGHENFYPPFSPPVYSSPATVSLYSNKKAERRNTYLVLHRLFPWYRNSYLCNVKSCINAQTISPASEYPDCHSENNSERFLNYQASRCIHYKFNGLCNETLLPQFSVFSLYQYPNICSMACQ